MTDLSEIAGIMCVPSLSAQTRFYRPPLPQGHVFRQRLCQQLRDGLSGRLLLISAPAGFGKSSLASEFCEHLPPEWHHLWLGLSERDHDPCRFLERLVLGLQQRYGSLGDELLNVLKVRQRHQPFAFEQWMDALLDELPQHVNAQQPLLLVLDDYHLAQSEVLDRCLQFFLSHLPSGIVLLVTSRKRPNWHFARLRLSKLLLELSEHDLRLTREELEAFLQGQDSEGQAADLDGLLLRSEGWVAGLRLWRLAGEQGQDLPSLQGHEGLIREYLLEEVIERQPADVQQFLYQTAGLERFCAELCDAVRDSHDSAEILAHLQSNQVFLVPLDEQGRWFRYHHLFSDLLNAAESNGVSARQRAMHLRACRWYTRQGQTDAAVEQALLADQADVAASLVQGLSEEQMLGELNIAMLLRWKANLPDELLLSTPRLIVLYSWALALSCQLDAAKDLLAQLSRFLPAADEIVQRSLLAQWQALDGFIARGCGDRPLAQRQCEEALLALGPDRYGSQFMCLGTLANLALSSGDITRARMLNRQALELAQRVQNPLFEAFAYYERARVLQARGEVIRALEQVRVGLARVSFLTDQRSYSIRARLHIYEGYLLALNLQVEPALQALRKGIDEALACRDVAVLTGYCVMANIQGRQGQIAEAFSLLAEAERQMHLWDVPAVYYLGIVTLVKCELWMRQGQLEYAALWMQQLEDAYRTWTAPEFHPQLLQHIDLLMAVLEQRQGLCAQAEQRLKKLLAYADKQGLVLIAILAQVQLVQLYKQQGQEREARVYLEAALELAKAGGVLPFSDLLQHAKSWFADCLQGQKHGVARDTLLTHLTQTQQDAPELEPEYTLAEKLSSREMAVLQLIARGCSNQEISDQLFISLHTVKTHARHINSKLGVERRTQAVARAKSLGLLS